VRRSGECWRAWAVLLMKSEVEDKDVRISWRFTALRKQGRRMPTYTVLRDGVDQFFRRSQ